MTFIHLPLSSHVRMNWLPRPALIHSRTLSLLLVALLSATVHTCSASAMWPGDEAYGLEPLTLSSALLDSIDTATLYTPTDSFTPLDLSLDDDPSTSHHSFTPLSLDFDDPLPSSSSSSSYHDFLLLSTTGSAYDESFYMTGAYHTMPAGAPATFSDVGMVIREGGGNAGDGVGVQYGGVLSMTVRCMNGSLTLLYEGEGDGVVIEDGDAVVSNDTFTFTNVTFTSTLAAANTALSSFTFTPATSAAFTTVNVTCPYLVLTNQSLYTGAFTFNLTTPPPLAAPAATTARVAFNLTVIPNAAQLYALYTGLPIDVAAVLGVAASRVVVEQATVNAAGGNTEVVMDFLPAGFHLMQANQNNSVAQLVAAFIALSPVQLSQTTWMKYVQPSSIAQLCADGSYRTSCVVVAGAAVAAAATAVTSSLAFIVAMSVGGTLLVAATAVVGWRYAVRRNSTMQPPLSPLRKASFTEEVLASVHPNMSAVMESSPESLAIVQDAISVAIDDQLVAMETDPTGTGSRRSSRAVFGGGGPSSRRASSRRSGRVQFAPPQPGGAERLEMDVQGRLRAGGVGEGRRFLYQPQLVVNDRRMTEVVERRQSIVHQIEQQRQRHPELDRGSLIEDAYFSPLSRGSAFTLSPSRASLAAIAALSVPPLLMAGSKKHLHYGDGDDSSDDDNDNDQYAADGPKFINASSATASTSPQPQPLPASASPSTALHPNNSFTGILPTFPHPSTFLPQHLADTKRASNSRVAGAGRQSSSRGKSFGLESGWGGEEGLLDGLHVGYAADGADDGSGANTPSLSTQDIADDWLVEDDGDEMEQLEQGTAQQQQQQPSLSAQPQQQHWNKAPSARSSLQSHDAKRGSWARDNAKRQSGNGKRSSGRITLNLSKVGLSLNPVPAPAQHLSSHSKANLPPAAPTRSLWSKLGLASGGGQEDGMVKEPMANRPLMRPLIANAPLHHPRMSLYQQRAVY